MEEEIREEAMKRYLKGEAAKDIYTDLKRSKKWFFKWLKRYRSGRPDWNKEKSRVPLKRPTETKEVQRQRIISIRKHLESESFSQIGVSAIKWEMNKLGINFPSDRTINRILKREGLVKKNFLCTQRGRVSILYRTARSEPHSPG